MNAGLGVEEVEPINLRVNYEMIEKNRENPLVKSATLHGLITTS